MRNSSHVYMVYVLNSHVERVGIGVVWVGHLGLHFRDR